MNFKLNSQQEIAAFISANAHDVTKMNELAAYYQSLNSSSNDAGLASSVNEDVQIVQSKESTMGELFEKVEVTNNAPKPEPNKTEEKISPIQKVKVVRKPRVSKAKEVVALERKFHTIGEVADCYRIGKSTIHKYLQNGLIEGFKMGNQWRFSQEQIDAFESRISSTTK